LLSLNFLIEKYGENSGTHIPQDNSPIDWKKRPLDVNQRFRAIRETHYLEKLLNNFQKMSFDEFYRKCKIFGDTIKNCSDYKAFYKNVIFCSLKVLLN
jgi:hypothetical protein